MEIEMKVGGDRKPARNNRAVDSTYCCKEVRSGGGGPFTIKASPCSEVDTQPQTHSDGSLHGIPVSFAS